MLTWEKKLSSKDFLIVVVDDFGGASVRMPVTQFVLYYLPHRILVPVSFETHHLFFRKIGRILESQRDNTGRTVMGK